MSFPKALRAQVERVQATTGSTLAPGALARLTIAWTQLFGMIGFELFGRLVGTADPAGPFFDHTVREMAAFLGLHRPNVAHTIGAQPWLPVGNKD